MQSKTILIISGLLIVAAVAYLIVSNTGSTARYFLTVGELQAMGDKVLGRNLTISGVVLGDTIVYAPSVPRVTFTIVQVPADPKEVERAGGLVAVRDAAVNDPTTPRLEVVYDGVKPDLLQHKSQVIVRGQLQADGCFHASELLLKCPSRYTEDVAGGAGGD